MTTAPPALPAPPATTETLLEVTPVPSAGFRAVTWSITDVTPAGTCDFGRVNVFAVPAWTLPVAHDEVEVRVSQTVIGSSGMNSSAPPGAR
jgi:hypothetical protein